jgi:hypothetical protein
VPRAARPAWLLAPLLGLGGALAQAPIFVPTGVLTATIDGTTVVFRPHANLVPETDAEASTDASVDALIERLSGREVNGASFIVTEPLVVGDVTAFPATMTVNLRAMVAPDDRSDRRELVIGFGVDPDTLAWDGDEGRVAVEFHPERWRATAHYQLLELHAFEVTRLEAVEPHALRVAGRLVQQLHHHAHAQEVAEAVLAHPQHQRVDGRGHRRGEGRRGGQRDGQQHRVGRHPSVTAAW